MTYIWFQIPSGKGDGIIPYDTQEPCENKTSLVSRRLYVGLRTHTYVRGLIYNTLFVSERVRYTRGNLTTKKIKKS